MKRVAFLVCTILTAALLSACGTAYPVTTDQPANPDVTESKTLETAEPTVEETAVPTQMPEITEGTKADSETMKTGYRPGYLTMSSGIRGLSRSDNCYEYSFAELPEYSDEAYEFGGKTIYYYLFNADLCEVFHSRAVTSPDDAAYVISKISDLSYMEITSSEAVPLPSNCRMCIIVKNVDGTAELYGIGQDEAVFRSICSNASELNSAVFTEISSEPLPEIVSLHIAAQAFHYMYETELPTKFTEYSDADFGAVIMDGASVKLGSEALSKLKACFSEKEFIGEGDPSAACDIHTFGDANVFPSGSLKVIFASEDHGRDPAEYRKYTVVVPDGHAYFVQEGPVAFTTADGYQYVVGASHIIDFPFKLDYALIASLFNS